MQAVSGINQAQAISASRSQTTVASALLRKQLDTVEQVGQAAIDLLESASQVADPTKGRNVNVLV